MGLQILTADGGIDDALHRKPDRTRRRTGRAGKNGVDGHRTLSDDLVAAKGPGRARKLFPYQDAAGKIGDYGIDDVHAK